jgi:peroxiredoxin
VVILVYWRPDQDRSVLALKDIRDILKKNNDKGIQVIGIVSGNEDPQAVKKIIKDNQIDFPVVIDAERNVFSDYGIHVYPSTVIINKEGKVVYGHPGHAHDYLIIIEGYIQLEFISPPKNK